MWKVGSSSFKSEVMGGAHMLGHEAPCKIHYEDQWCCHKSSHHPSPYKLHMQPQHPLLSTDDSQLHHVPEDDDAVRLLQGNSLIHDTFLVAALNFSLARSTVVDLAS